MRRLLRILLNVLTTLSLLLFLATVVAWVRSYWRVDAVHWIQTPSPGERSRFFGVHSGGGGVQIFWGYDAPGDPRDWVVAGWSLRTAAPVRVPYAAEAPTNRWGFDYSSERDARGSLRGVTFPFWLPTALFAALPLARGALFVRRRWRFREGHCSKCGYDLRATPDRCPECGTIPAR